MKFHTTKTFQLLQARLGEVAEPHKGTLRYLRWVYGADKTVQLLIAFRDIRSGDETLLVEVPTESLGEAVATFLAENYQAGSTLQDYYEAIQCYESVITDQAFYASVDHDVPTFRDLHSLMEKDMLVLGTFWVKAQQERSAWSRQHNERLNAQAVSSHGRILWATERNLPVRVDHQVAVGIQATAQAADLAQLSQSEQEVALVLFGSNIAAEKLPVAFPLVWGQLSPLQQERLVSGLRNRSSFWQEEFAAMHFDGSETAAVKMWKNLQDFLIDPLQWVFQADNRAGRRLRALALSDSTLRHYQDQPITDAPRPTTGVELTKWVLPRAGTLPLEDLVEILQNGGQALGVCVLAAWAATRDNTQRAHVMLAWDLSRS